MSAARLSGPGEFKENGIRGEIPRAFFRGREESGDRIGWNEPGIRNVSNAKTDEVVSPIPEMERYSKLSGFVIMVQIHPRTIIVLHHFAESSRDVSRRDGS